MSQTKTIEQMSKTELKEFITTQQEALRIATNKIRHVKKLRSENCKSESSYHFSMSAFKEHIFANAETYKDFIVSDNENETVMNKEFKTVFIAKINNLLNK